MMKVLVTGFDPFGGETVNPSWEAVKRLPDTVGGWRVVRRQIPTLFGGGAEAVLRAAEEEQPDAILCVGQAGGRRAVTPEVVGINLREAGIADNVGYLAQNEPVDPAGPAAYFATLPVRDMVQAMRDAGLPAALSYSAGAFVCNDVLYTLLRRYEGTGVRVGFLHVPFLPEQAGESRPSMALEEIVRALEAAIGALRAA